MMIGQMTFKQGQACARLIAELRPDWDAYGIEAALQAARELAPAPDLAIAAIRAAMNTRNNTPKVIGLPGPHWRGSDTAPKHPEPGDDERCSICSEPRGVCRVRWYDDHKFLSVDETRRQATQARASRAAQERADCAPEMEASDDTR